MPDPIFAHPRLAPLYDLFDGPRDDLDVYLALIDELGAHRVLDVGCGTGCLAVRLADTGREVIGVDPAEASLAVARAKDPAGRITWRHGDATTLPALAADLAVLTGNVAQVFVTDAEWAATLRGLRGALRPGGHLVFEIRRPQRQVWLDWAADPAEVTVDVPGIGPVTQWREVTEVSLPLVSFRHYYRFPDGEVLVSDSVLRFRDEAELTASLTEAGFDTREVREAPDRPGREFVFVAVAR